MNTISPTSLQEASARPPVRRHEEPCAQEAEKQSFLNTIRENRRSREHTFRSDAESIMGLCQLGMTRREIGDEIGYSPAWVQQHITWAKSGYVGGSPFDRARLAAKQAADDERKEREAYQRDRAATQVVAESQAEDEAAIARGEKVFDEQGYRIHHTAKSRRAAGMQFDYVAEVNKPLLEGWLEQQVSRMVLQSYGYSAAKFAYAPEKNTKQLAIIEQEKLALYKEIAAICARKLKGQRT
jgi:hypothetical protein